MAQIRNGWRSERGAELIEFAVVMPILIFIIAGIFEFGMMFRALEAVTNAAREGARVGVLPGYNPPDVQTRVNDYLDAAGLTGTHTTTVTEPDPRDRRGDISGQVRQCVVPLSVRRAQWLRSASSAATLRVDQPDRRRDHANGDSSDTLREKS